MSEQVETLIVGGGQAGVALSEHLTKRGAPHLILERGRIAERWRSERWDSLVANGPAWHDRFASKAFDRLDGDAFAPAAAIADYIAEHAREIDAPIRCGVEVTQVRREGAGFVAQTSAGIIEARNVVAATGPFQRPVIPDMVGDPSVFQVHSAHYRNPGQLPEGAVLVVGSGSSGAQIADELRKAGRKVYLSVGPHDRPPRRYRGRDYCWWLGALGVWDARAATPGREHVTIAVSGADGGHTVDFRKLAHNGITLVGMAQGFAGGTMRFAPDVPANIAAGDLYLFAMLDAADAHAAKEGLDLPPEPQARALPPDPDCLIHPVRALNLAEASVRSIVWATGYALDFGWLAVDAFDAQGRPIHERGVSKIPGLYFLGLSWLSRRASAFIWGVWHDADYLAHQIAP